MMARTTSVASIKDEAKDSIDIVIRDDDGLHTLDMEDEPQPIPWKFKWVALACVISLPLGRRWASSTLGPLKNTLRNELGINNAQYGVMSSADGLVNTLLPIFGGMLLDWWGPNSVTLVCTTVMLGGNALAAGATNLGKWRVLVAGQIIEGLGVAVLDSAQHKVCKSLLSMNLC